MIHQNTKHGKVASLLCISQTAVADYEQLTLKTRLKLVANLKAYKLEKFLRDISKMILVMVSNNTTVILNGFCFDKYASFTSF